MSDDARVLDAASDMLAALRKVPLFRLADDGLGWQCAGCGSVFGVTTDGFNREEDCKPGCYVPVVEAAINKAEGHSIAPWLSGYPSR